MDRRAAHQHDGRCDRGHLQARPYGGRERQDQDGCRKDQSFLKDGLGLQISRANTHQPPYNGAHQALDGGGYRAADAGLNHDHGREHRPVALRQVHQAGQAEGRSNCNRDPHRVA